MKHLVTSMLIGSLGLAGCIESEEPIETSETTQAATTAFANDKPAYDFFVAKGLKPWQAAGIVGNLGQESGVNPNAVQPGGPGRGLAQWSVGGRWDSGLNQNLVWFANSRGQSRWDFNLQLEFIWWEFTNKGYGFNDLKNSGNVTDATLIFMRQYEICGQCETTTRLRYAKNVLAAYGQSSALGAKYVSQSWPLASQGSLRVRCGDTVDANIVLKNTGTRTWDTNTRLGTTGPRDRASIFAGADWVSPSRPAAINGTVAPGANGTFAFKVHGPTGAACVPGTYREHIGVVQEGTGWFSDNGQAGPPDEQIEMIVNLVDANSPADDPNDGGGGGGDGTGSGADGQPIGDEAGGCSATTGAGGYSALLVAFVVLGARRRRRAA